MIIKACKNCGQPPDERDKKRIKNDLAVNGGRPVGWLCEKCAPDLALASSGLTFDVVDVVRSSPAHQYRKSRASNHS